MSIDSGTNSFFKPRTKADTVQVAFAAASASANVALNAYAAGSVFRVYNACPVTVYINWDTANTAAAAKATAMPIPANSIEYIRIPDDLTYTYVAVIPDSSTTGTVFFTVGSGAA